MSCSKCKKELFIVNKKYNLCDECNHFRLHKETKFETFRKQNEKYQKKSLEKQKNKPFSSKISKPISNISKKETVQKQNLSLVKNRIEERAKEEEKYYCWGCGRVEQHLDKSHILSVKQRKDLELEEENMNLFCRSCHEKWESWDIVQMLDLLTFEKDLLYIQQNDERIFQRIKFKFLEFLEEILEEEYYLTDTMKSNILKAKTIFYEK